MKSIVFAIITIFIGISIAIPIKDHDIDELVLRVNELRRLNPYQDDGRFYARNLDSIGGGNLLRSLGSNIENFDADESGIQQTRPEFYGRNTFGKHQRNTLSPLLTQRIVRSLDSIGGGNLIRALDSIGGGHLVKRTIDTLGGANLVKRTVDTLGGANLLNKRYIDLDRNPTLYGYYAGVLNNIYDKRNSLDNDKQHSLEKVLILQDALEPSSDYTASLLDESAFGKRNFDEIDRALIGGLKKRLFSYRLPRLLSNNYESYNNSPMDMSSKRNFDEIDRAGFTTLKRNFDEIDRAGFVGLKRSFLDRNPSSSTSSLSSASVNKI